MKTTRLFLLMLMLTVSAMAVQSGGGRLGSSYRGEDSIGGSNSTTTCDYWIDCDLDGAIDAECCGSFEACLYFCDEFCGTTCTYYD